MMAIHHHHDRQCLMITFYEYFHSFHHHQSLSRYYDDGNNENENKHMERLLLRQQKQKQKRISNIIIHKSMINHHMAIMIGSTTTTTTILAINNNNVGNDDIIDQSNLIPMDHQNQHQQNKNSYYIFQQSMNTFKMAIRFWLLSLLFIITISGIFIVCRQQHSFKISISYICSNVIQTRESPFEKLSSKSLLNYNFILNDVSKNRKNFI